LRKALISCRGEAKHSSGLCLEAIEPCRRVDEHLAQQPLVANQASEGFMFAPSSSGRNGSTTSIGWFAGRLAPGVRPIAAPNNLLWGPEIDPGVPVLFTRPPRRLALALKSGNFGAPDFFSRALSRLSGEAPRL
jgi:hypothetical protein